MKKYITGSLFLLAILFGVSLFSNTAEAGYVKGYYKPSIGTYVQPYYRSNPNNTKLDNYSTKGNHNPYTGSKGYTSPYKSYTIPSYKAPSYKSYTSPYKSYKAPSYKSYYGY